MWMKWLPWRWIVRSVARKHRFLDPITLISRLERFSQPSEVAAPIELLRSGAVMHARGLMNSQAIQHNLDWIWPFWVERQFNPEDEAFVPRAFSITHINLTHRNWTAVGIPDTDQWPIIDPRGLVTPFHDSWSLDVWIVDKGDQSLFPSRLACVSQEISTEGNLTVTTQMKKGALSLTSKIEVVGESELPVCQISIIGHSDVDARMVVALRPYNPEGVSFVHDVAWQENLKGWVVNDEYLINFSDFPEQFAFSDYRRGDVYSHLPSMEEKTIEAREGIYQKDIHCEVGMATAAALFGLKANQKREIVIHIPLTKNEKIENLNVSEHVACQKWEDNTQKQCQLKIPDEHFKFLYDTAIRTLVLHSPEDVYPGPFTYKRFWFRDAAFILNAMLCVGLKERVRRVLHKFPSRQTRFGYFLSQEGEWDSNGEALWILQRFCQLTGTAPDPEWRDSIYKGGQWIGRKRMKVDSESIYSGLLPAGFSAEHLGLNDCYYWDDFWGVAGLKAAGFLADAYGDKERAGRFNSEARDFYQCIEKSLKQVEVRLKQPIVPAAGSRRMDAGAIGSLVADYPLQIFPAKDERIARTVDFLIKNSLVSGGFFQDMTHSGINPYLTLHIAQVLARAGDARFFDLMTAVAKLASPTGQWPEAVHPRTKGGCMGDGQHVWAAAEWVMMIRNCFVREEEDERRLVLCCGIPKVWLEKGEDLSFGPTSTLFGKVSVSIRAANGKVTVKWEARWFGEEPAIDVCFPGLPKVAAEQGKTSVQIDRNIV